MKNPNIIVLFADDQRFNTIQALGNNEVQTPNLDSLVDGGTAFTKAHIPGGTIGAVCMPSRAMLHTGRTLFHLQGEGQGIPRDHTMLGEYLQNHGYDSYGIGKWHNGSESFSRSFNGGDEIFFGGMWDHWNVPAFHYDPTGRYEPVPCIRDPFYSREVSYLKYDHISPGAHSTDIFTEAAVNYLRNRKGHSTGESGESKPFFLYTSFMAPHDPRSMPAEFLEMFDPEDIEIPANFAQEHEFDYGIREVRDEVLAAYPRTDGEIRRHIAEYYAMIGHLDDGIGKILSALDDTGERDNTIVVFAGDNGLALGQHGLMGKQSAYEHSVRVPLILNGPGIPVGTVRDQPCYLLDIFPTLIDLLGGEQPSSIDGQSLVPLLIDGSAPDIRNSMYFAYEDKVRAVKTGDYKLVEYAGNEFRETQLFHLASDPDEIRNCALEQPEIVQQLRDELFHLRDEWGDLQHPTGQRFWKYMDT